MSKSRCALLALITLLMLLLFAAAVPSGAILPEAMDAYMEESADDTYDFL